MVTACFWNDIYQVLSKSKYVKVFENKKTERHKDDSYNRSRSPMLDFYFYHSLVSSILDVEFICLFDLCCKRKVGNLKEKFENKWIYWVVTSRQMKKISQLYPWLKQAHKNKATCMFTSGTHRPTVNWHEHHIILIWYWETLVYVNKNKYNK